MKRPLFILLLGVTDCAAPLAPFAPACMLAAGGCDLPELGMHPHSDMGGNATDMNFAANMDLSNGNTNPDLLQTAPSDLAAFDDGGIPAGAALGTCNPSSWTASASVSHPVNPPNFAIDGLAPTRWSTGVAQAVGQYFQIDFGGFVNINQVSLTHTYANDGLTDFPRGVDVLVSYDGVDYSRKLQSATFAADPGVVTLNFPWHAARYLRLQLNQATAPAWFTIHELQIGCQSSVDGGVPGSNDGGPFDGGTGVVNPNHANWVVSASSSDANSPVTNAIDGNAATRWADGKTPQYGDEWFLLDLGMPLSISRVSLSTQNSDWPSAYELDLSTDNVTFTPVASGLGADPALIAFKTQTARYIRIRQIGSGYDHWWGINEITVIQ